MTIRVSTAGGLSVPSIRLGTLHVSNGWTEVDLNDPQVRDTLTQYVPTHLRIHPDDVNKLNEFDLKMDGGKLVSTTNQTKPGDDQYQKPPKPGEPQPQQSEPKPLTPTGDPTTTPLQEPHPTDKNRRGR